MGFSQRLNGLNGGGEEGGGGAEREGRELNDKQERPCTMPEREDRVSNTSVANH